MVGESGTSHMKDTIHRYYKCVSVKRHKPMINCCLHKKKTVSCKKTLVSMDYFTMRITFSPFLGAVIL